MDTRPLPAARVVLGRYRLGPAIGRGGTATVYAGEDMRSGARVAVKEIADPSLAPRALSEVRAGARLRHPAIVPVVDWGEEDGGLLIVSDLVDGPSLASRLARADVSDAEAVAIARSILAGLAHAHARGVVHRDVKPGNVLLDPVAGARLTDFGIARLSGEATMTMTGAVLGTMAYMAPEQALGRRAEEPADVYATCVVLYEALSGANPLAAGSPAATARRAASADIPALASVRPDLPEALTRAVAAGLARDPARRPSAEDLRDALRGGEGLARRSRLVARAGAVVAGAGAGALAWVAAQEGTSLEGAAALAVAAGVGMLGAWRPRLAALVLAGLGLAALGRMSPGAAVVIGVLGLVIALPVIGTRRMLLAPPAAPALAAATLVPLYPAACALVRGIFSRLWIGVAGVAAVIVWQVTAGRAGPVVRESDAAAIASGLDGERSPARAAETIWGGLAADPTIAVRGGTLILAAVLAGPLLAGAERGRLVRAGAWCALVATGLAVATPDPLEAVAAATPGAIVVMAIAARPWRHLPRRSPYPSSATLHDPT